VGERLAVEGPVALPVRDDAIFDRFAVGFSQDIGGPCAPRGVAFDDGTQLGRETAFLDLDGASNPPAFDGLFEEGFLAPGTSRRRQRMGGGGRH
jgi:hypothetical protein